MDVRRALRRGLALLAAGVLAWAIQGSGCQPDCQDACDNDDDCGGDLVCYGGRCAPKECRDRCLDVGVNQCLVNRATCTYLGCQN